MSATAAAAELAIHVGPLARLHDRLADMRVRIEAGGSA